MIVSCCSQSKALGLASALLLTCAAAPVALGQTAAPTACEDLAKLALPQATITMAVQVPAGEFQLPARPSAQPPQAAPAQPASASSVSPAGNMPPGNMPFLSPNQGPNPAFCRVAATLAPSADSSIKIEVWMPLSGWNGVFHGVANTGWAGSVMYSGLLDSIQHGFAAVSTDTGHEAPPQGQPNGTFIPGHPEKLVDYGNRAIHLMTVNGKQIVQAFYGKPAKFAVFTGCSLGGMQALGEASRYPEDYDGIVAGAPANPMTMFNAAQLWPFYSMSKTPGSKMTKAHFTLVHDAAVKACAGKVGLAQNFIDDPKSCHFDVQSLLCKGADTANCLTQPQVDLMKAIYQGPVNPRTHEAIFPGPPVGAELQLDYYTGDLPMANALNMYRYGVFQDPNWDFGKMDYDTAIDKARQTVDPLMKAGDNLTPFLKKGGKLMIYIGWTDYHNPMEIVGYYNRVAKNAGNFKVADSIRLFFIPGMDHCFGGYGCDTFDKLGTIAKWVESKSAPDEIPASKLIQNKVVRTAKLCAYPKLAQYKGSGDMDDAANFTCVDSPAAKK